MKRVILSGAVIVLAVAGTGVGQAAPAVYKVTGGGQMTAVNQAGAGSTIAFTGQSQSLDGEPAKGQFQLQLRDGISKETIHGTISCVVVFQPADGGPGMAVLGGQSRAGTPFRIDVTDDGQGKDTMDMVSVRRGADAQDGGDDDENDTALCDQEKESADTLLGRGNVKIHKAQATRS